MMLSCLCLFFWRNELWCLELAFGLLFVSISPGTTWDIIFPTIQDVIVFSTIYSIDDWDLYFCYLWLLVMALIFLHTLACRFIFRTACHEWGRVGVWLLLVSTHVCFKYIFIDNVFFLYYYEAFGSKLTMFVDLYFRSRFMCSCHNYTGPSYSSLGC